MVITEFDVEDKYNGEIVDVLSTVRRQYLDTALTTAERAKDVMAVFSQLLPKKPNWDRRIQASRISSPHIMIAR